MCVSDGKRFLFFAFRQLRRLPPEWQAHYRYELVNQVHQLRDLESCPDPLVASKPLFWTRNFLRRGYHGVRWALSRFDLDCPPIPEEFEGPEGNIIFTNETVHGVRRRWREEPGSLALDGGYRKVRTMSSAEAAAWAPGAAGENKEDKGRWTPPKRPDVESTLYWKLAPERFQDPADMDEEDREDDMNEEETGGLILGDRQGYPPGLGPGDAEYEVKEDTWHPNKTVDFSKERVEKLARNPYASGSISKGIEPHRQERLEEAHRQLELHRGEQQWATDPQGCSAYDIPRRWVRGADGKWTRLEKVPEPKMPTRHRQPLGWDPDEEVVDPYGKLF
eukprot:TRINITY_DN60912_c0_g1_i1.p1 TRINITY_DN60912_c0_g1~~TRINITY_DN60912_c0_g1_i1.p1  ORF type:complete len:334 (+),score=69.09 TRINITY_DN60912_c0_g1_i1:76-1077(+)